VASQLRGRRRKAGRGHHLRWKGAASQGGYHQQAGGPRLPVDQGALRGVKIDCLQSFSQKSHTPTVAKEFQIGHYDPTEADLEHCWNCCSGGFVGERL